jgi:chemotaxis-related protein WspD
VPHRSGNILAGLVNIRGQLQLCVRLAGLLGLETPAADSPFVAPAARLLVVEHRGGRGMERWAFDVDEVAGVHRLPRQTLGSAPATVSNAAKHMTAGLFAWQDKTVGLLDEARLLNGLPRLVSG